MYYPNNQSSFFIWNGFFFIYLFTFLVKKSQENCWVGRSNLSIWGDSRVTRCSGLPYMYINVDKQARNMSSVTKLHRNTHTIKWVDRFWFFIPMTHWIHKIRKISSITIPHSQNQRNMILFMCFFLIFCSSLVNTFGCFSVLNFELSCVFGVHYFGGIVLLRGRTKWVMEDSISLLGFCC